MTRQRSVKKQQFNGPVSSYDPERFPAIAKALAEHGATQEEVAARLGITSRQLRTWRAQYPELRDAMDAGNDVFDTRVERALAERAIGFYETWEEEKFNPVTGRKELLVHREYYPPDTKAARIWLTNRKRNDWKNVPKHEVETKRRSSDEILARIYERLAKLKEQGYLTTIELPALPAPQDDSDVED
jgi:transposase-like protein